jgi:hypothetical protein
MAALDHLRYPDNAIKAAARGILVRWPECRWMDGDGRREMDGWRWKMTTRTTTGAR